MVQVLDVDALELEQARQQDIADHERWLDEPIPRELTIRVIPAFHISRPVPDGLDREQAIAWALEQARQQPKFKMCLRLSRRERVWIEEGGQSYKVEQVQTSGINLPSMNINGRPFRFVEKPAAHQSDSGNKE